MSASQSDDATFIRNMKSTRGKKVKSPFIVIGLEQLTSGMLSQEDLDDLVKTALPLIKKSAWTNLSGDFASYLNRKRHTETKGKTTWKVKSSDRKGDS